MQIDTKKTVQKTLDKYQWDNPVGWKRDSLGEFSREVYKKNNLTIRQKMNDGYQAVCFETPDFTMYVSSGMYSDLMAMGNNKKVRYYSLDVETTLSERKLYHSMQDESGYKSIKGERQFILNFLEKVPDAYFVLDKDENASHVSYCYMRPINNVVKHRKPLCRMGKERT